MKIIKAKTMAANADELCTNVPRRAIALSLLPEKNRA
jgi:hypothetical protein